MSLNKTKDEITEFQSTADSFNMIKEKDMNSKLSINFSTK